MGRLDGKTVLISGTAGGQGRAAARIFAREGARVVGCDIRGDAAAETVELVRADGHRMLSPGPFDLATADGATAWVRAAVEAHGTIDVLYNNASTARFSPFMETTSEDWSSVMRNELEIVFHCCQAAWPYLSVAGGSVVNVASTSGLVGSRTLPTSAHSAAKAGVLGLTRQLAAEGAPVGIRVNSITPGLVRSPATETRLAQGEDGPLAGLVAATALGIGEPEDVAYGALYLASDESRWVTGTNLAIDGGRSTIH